MGESETNIHACLVYSKKKGRKIDFILNIYDLFVYLRKNSNTKYSKMEKLTYQEEEVMLLVWQKGEGTIRDYYALKKEHVPYTTFASIIKNLERKKYIKLRRIGTTNLCIPLVDESDYKSKFMSGFIRNYFQNSYKEMVSFFVREEKISADELKEILRIIRKNEHYTERRVGKIGRIAR